MPRFHCPSALRSGDDIELPPGAARVQVLRLQPGDGITLFQGRAGEGFSGGEFEATVLRMGRSDVAVRIGAHHAVEREPLRPVHLLAGITANERMDWLVEKAAELGAASITPLVAERSVLKLKGERAEKSWRTGRPWPCRPASSARNRVPPLHAPTDLQDWLEGGAKQLPPGTLRLLLSLGEGTRPLGEIVDATAEDAPVVFLSGPEGASPAEEALARAQGFVPVTLGPRVLRAETAPLAALAALTLD